MNDFFSFVCSWWRLFCSNRQHPGLNSRNFWHAERSQMVTRKGGRRSRDRASWWTQTTTTLPQTLLEGTRTHFAVRDAQEAAGAKKLALAVVACGVTRRRGAERLWRNKRSWEQRVTTHWPRVSNGLGSTAASLQISSLGRRSRVTNWAEIFTPTTVNTTNNWLWTVGVKKWGRPYLLHST